MPQFKEKPPMGQPKAKRQSALSPRQAARLVKEKYLQQLDQSGSEAKNPEVQATEHVEEAGRWAADEAGLSASRATHRNRKAPKERGRASKSPPDPKQTKPQFGENGANPAKEADPRPNRLLEGYTPANRPETTSPPGAAVRSRKARRQLALNNRRRSSSAIRRSGPNANRRSAEGLSSIGRGGAPGRERSKIVLKTRMTNGKPVPGPKVRASPIRSPLRQSTSPFQQAGQRKMARQMLTRSKQAIKSVAAGLRFIARTVTRAVAAMTGAVVGVVGGTIILVALIVIIIIAAVANSPFGLFFAQERNAPETVSVSEAVAQVNIHYNAKLEELQSGDYDDIVIHGQAADWPEVLAVFAVKTSGTDDGVDVATLDPDRVERLTTVFWDMVELSSWVETIDHPGDGEDDPGWTEYILHIEIAPKTADDMRGFYSFTDYQNSALDELLADRAALSALAGSLAITSADARAVLDALPEDLSPERRAVIETALTLYGKVNYFWGGKSLVLGWDSRWGQLTEVWAAGSSTTGTYRPYGLDCSGFVDWVFYNVSGGDYIIGHGGGAHAQHTYCSSITWDEALPGDLVFYPDDEHVGIVCGRAESGGLLVVHCASGANNVVVTNISGFTSIGRPAYYME